MYFWDVKALAQDLKDGKVSQREKMKYFLAISVLEGLGTLLRINDGGDMVGIRDIFYLIILAVGIFLCYKANSRGDDKEFIDRFICLSWPISIRLSLLLAVSTFLWAMVADWIGISPLEVIAMEIFVTASCVIYFAWIRSYIIRVSETKNDLSNVNATQ